jgi:hypothetical protein
LTAAVFALGVAAPAASANNPFAGRGMWIWTLASSDRGSLSAIIAAARRFGISTVTIKSADGSGTWSQFSPGLVHAFHANHINVCAWQYIYGAHPEYEARAAAVAIHDGADCFVIDAEVEYEGRYNQAQAYISTLRSLIGYSYPVALAGFPYVDYHPSFPYSVFLGPGGAQYNTPQMYWHDIGVSVDQVYKHTYLFNRPYGRPIDPLGQAYGNPPGRDIRRFRQVSRYYHAGGLSWFDWQEAPADVWYALSQRLGGIRGFRPITGWGVIQEGNQGDLVVWAQEHLAGAGYSVSIDGAFGPLTQAALERFQRAHGIPGTGKIGPMTWNALLRYRPAPVHWSRSQIATVARVGRTGARLPPPKSASLPDRANELHGFSGAGQSRDERALSSPMRK